MKAINYILPPTPLSDAKETAFVASEFLLFFGDLMKRLLRLLSPDRK